MNFTRYRHLAIERAKPAPTEAQLSEIETLLEARLPASFKDYLKVANGGSHEYGLRVPTGPGEHKWMQFGALFSANTGTGSGETFVDEIRWERECTEIPKGVLPFARDGGGSMLYLDLTAEGNGCVIAFVQGLPAWTGKRTDSAFIEVAPSFDAYIDQLSIDLDAAKAHLATGVSTRSHIAAMEEHFDIALPDWRTDVSLADAVAAAKRRVG